MGKKKELVLKNGMMVNSMKENGKIVKIMVMGFINLKMEVNIEENGKKVNFMALENS